MLRSHRLARSPVPPQGDGRACGDARATGEALPLRALRAPGRRERCLEVHEHALGLGRPELGIGLALRIRFASMNESERGRAVHRTDAEHANAHESGGVAGSGDGGVRVPPARRSKRLVATSVLAVIWGTTPPLWGFFLLANLGPFSEWLRQDPQLGLLAFVGLFIIAAGTGLLPTYSQAILGGWAFGFKWGFIGSIFGFVGGAFVGWAIARAVSGRGVESWLDSKPKARIVREALVEQGFWKSLLVVTLLRVPPNSPFALSNLAMTASGVHIAPYLIGTAIGMIPRTAVACWIAAEGATHAEDLQSLVKEKGWGMALLGVAILAISLGVIGAIGKAALRRAMRSGRLPEEC